MNRTTCWLIAGVFCWGVTATVAEDAGVAKLEPLRPTPLLQKPPEGLPGGYRVAEVPPQVEFAVFPGQFDGARLWSSWGDALCAADGRFYASVGDHDAPHGTTFVYAVDPVAKTVSKGVDGNAVVPVPVEKYSPGKIHAPLIQAADGGIYLFGYRGSVRQTTVETGYRGDWLLRYDPATGRTENLGMPIAFSSVPVLEYCPALECLYGMSVPGETMPESQTQFFRYDLAKRRVAFLCAADTQGPRAIVVSSAGKVFFESGADATGQRQIVAYDPDQNRVRPVSVKIPGDGTLRCVSRPDAQGVAYGISKDGVVFAFDTTQEQVRSLGPAFVAGKLYTAVCRLDPTGTYLYYVPGAHGRSSEIGTPVIQLNVKTRECKVLAFLNEAVRQQRQYNLGGTYGLALSGDGSQLLISFNGSRLPLGKQADFGLCAAILLQIPAAERQ